MSPNIRAGAAQSTTMGSLLRILSADSKRPSISPSLTSVNGGAPKSSFCGGSHLLTQWWETQAQMSRKREMTACAHVLVRVWCCCADCDACVTLGRRHEGSIVGCTYRLSRTVSRTRCATASTSRETKGSFGGLAKFIIDTFRIVSGGCGRVLT